MSAPITDRQLNRPDGVNYLRQRLPPGPGPHPVFLLIHGWTGDENSMSIFTSRLPPEALLIIPRGLHLTPLGGYGWQPEHPKKWASITDFQPAVEALMDLLDPLNFPTADFKRLSLVGFSQGAALAYTFTLLYPERVTSLAALAGFMPDGADAFIAGKPQVLKGKPVFVAHGTKDEMVPIERARQAVTRLDLAGAQVSYCESQVGHKLSTDCFAGLGEFFKKEGRNIIP